MTLKSAIQILWTKSNTFYLNYELSSFQFYIFYKISNFLLFFILVNILQSMNIKTSCEFTCCHFKSIYFHIFYKSSNFSSLFIFGDFHCLWIYWFRMNLHTFIYAHILTKKAIIDNTSQFFSSLLRQKKWISIKFWRKKSRLSIILFCLCFFNLFMIAFLVKSCI